MPCHGIYVCICLYSFGCVRICAEHIFGSAMFLYSLLYTAPVCMYAIDGNVRRAVIPFANNGATNIVDSRISTGPDQYFCISMCAMYIVAAL